MPLGQRESTEARPPVPRPSTRRTGKHTILFLAANPLRTDRLALDEEARAIQQELERSNWRELFDLVTRWATQPMDLLRELRRLKPTIVHFSGHGNDRCGTASSRSRDVNASESEPASLGNGIVLQSADGRPHLVTADALKLAFGSAGASVKLVVFNACHGGIHAKALLDLVGCVIAMRGSIRDDAARNFAVGFYGGLAEHEPVGTAFQQGVAAIHLAETTHATQQRDEISPQLLVLPGIDPHKLYLVGESQRTRWCSIAIKAHPSDLNPEVIARVREQLRLITGDASLEILNIQQSSVKLTVSLSAEALQLLQDLFNSGQLTQLCRFQLVSFQSNDTDQDRIQTPDRDTATVPQRPDLWPNASTPSGIPVTNDIVSFPDAVPSRIGRYELLARLAVGCMGESFLARLEGAAGFEKLVVIKRVLPHLASDARFRDTLIGEARVASMMSHANICQVYELGETDGQLYLVMEYLEGATLLSLLRKLSRAHEALDLGLVAGVVQQATDALHYAHELRDRTGESLGIVHRDVTPSNLFLTEAGVVKILDFGHTQTGTLKGKYAYMAPEQLRGAKFDRRADVFALGIVAYEMLALRRLFQRKTDYLTFRAVMDQPIADVRCYRPDCPELLAAALARALDGEPAMRFESARQFGSAVLDAIARWRRPWTQGEISEFVRKHFAAASTKRGLGIADAVATCPSRYTVPQITQIDDNASDAVDFPAVSDEISRTPVDARRLAWSHAQYPADDHGDPAAVSSSVATRLPVPQETQPTAVEAPQPSLLWVPAVLAMTVIVGSLLLVWRQTRITVEIRDGRGQRPGYGGSHDGGVVTERHSQDPNVASDSHFQVRTAEPADVRHCTAQHGNLPSETRLQIRLGPDGLPRELIIEPASVDATPLGACIRNVFKGAVLPPSLEFEVNVRRAD